MHSKFPDKLSIRVYYEDTDTGGVVYYANYLKFFERGRTEYLRALGVGQCELAAREKILFVVRNVNVSYMQAARLDELVDIHTVVSGLGASTVAFEQQAWRADTLLAKAEIQVCTVHADSFRPVRLPTSIRNLLKRPIENHASI